MKHHHFLSCRHIWISLLFFLPLFLFTQCSKDETNEPEIYPFQGKMIYSAYKSQLSVLKDQSSTIILEEDSNYERIHPRWSPDGSLIAYEREHCTHFGTLCGHAIQVIRQDGSIVKTFSSTDDPFQNTSAYRYPAWSPDGKQIACCLPGEERFSIRLLALDDNNDLFLANLDGFPQGFDWSPDGSKYVILSSKDPYSDPDMIRVLDSQGTVLASSAAPEDIDHGKSGQIRWSPDGTKILYTKGSYTESPSVMIIDAQLGTPEKITENGRYAAWSPDGTHIAYNSIQTSDGTAYSYTGLFMLDLNTGEKKRIGYSAPHMDWTE